MCAILPVVCHCSAANYKIVKFTNSWKTFREAAEKHQDDIYKGLLSEEALGEVVNPHDGYATSCMYTSSSKLKDSTLCHLKVSTPQLHH